jgi:hypothetical protein
MGSNINYKPLFIDKVMEFSESFPDYSLGEMLHGIVTQLNKNGVDINSKGDLLSLTDQQLYSAIDNTIKLEEKE